MMNKKAIQQIPSTSTVYRQTRGKFVHLSLKDLLMILIMTILPIVVAIHTYIISSNETKKAVELRQQQIYDRFLDYIYQLYLDNELDPSAEPWAFANARYRSANRQWDVDRKQQSIQFLKEKGLIGREYIHNDQGKIRISCSPDIIRLKHLNFDGVKFQSSAKHVYKLNLTCTHFEQVSLSQVLFSESDLNNVLFDQSYLSGSIFENTSLKNAIFYASDLNGVDFTSADTTGAHFINIDLSNVKISPEQLYHVFMHNVTTPDGTFVQQEIEPNIYDLRFLSSILVTTITNIPFTFPTKTLKNRLHNISTEATWSNKSTVIMQGLSSSPYGLAIDQQTGTVFVADYGASSIISWSSGQNGILTVVKNLSNPTDVLIDEDDHSLIIAHHGERNVLRWFLESGQIQNEVMIDNIDCYGLAISEQGTLYVTHEVKNEVKQYSNGNKTGVVVAGGYGAGGTLHQLNGPFYVAIDSDSAVYVHCNFF